MPNIRTGLPRLRLKPVSPGSREDQIDLTSPRDDWAQKWAAMLTSEIVEVVVGSLGVMCLMRRLWASHQPQARPESQSMSNFPCRGCAQRV